MPRRQYLRAKLVAPKCEHCHAPIARQNLARHNKSFHSPEALAATRAEYSKKLEAIHVLPPRSEWESVHGCASCDAFYPNCVLLKFHQSNCNGLREPGPLDFKCEYCDAIVMRKKWDFHMKGYHSAERIHSTNEESTRISNSSVAFYYFGILYSSLNSVRNREKRCNEMGGVAASGRRPVLTGGFL